MNVLRVKSGVQFNIISPGGFRILSALDQVANKIGFDITITSACDGEHSGINDPHHRGEAYDIRTNNLVQIQKDNIILNIMEILGWARLYGFLEDANTENEHIHFQVKKGTVYP